MYCTGVAGKLALAAATFVCGHVRVVAIALLILLRAHTQRQIYNGEVVALLRAGGHGDPDNLTTGNATNIVAGPLEVAGNGMQSFRSMMLHFAHHRSHTDRLASQYSCSLECLTDITGKFYRVDRYFACVSRLTSSPFTLRCLRRS